MRDAKEIIARPLGGDVIEVGEVKFVGSTDECVVETILRVLAVMEEYVWFKEYGIGGRCSCHVRRWIERLESAESVKVVRVAETSQGINE